MPGFSSRPGADRSGNSARAAASAFVTERLVAPAQAFVHTEVAGGMVVLVAAMAAFAWANSSFSESYFDFWHSEVSIAVGRLSIQEDLVHFVNDGLMAIFFFVIGLETKRELLHGELNSARKAALPVAAAVGGMLVPAAIYALLNFNGEGSKGWGVPMATDIAFALGVLALLGRRAPFALKVFLLALAVVDDIGAILVIALFYTSALSVEALAWAGLALAAIAMVRILGLRSIDLYIILGVLFWLAVLKSGVHATIAGVVLAMLTPARPDRPIEDFRAEADDLLRRFDDGIGDGREEQQTILYEFETAVLRSEAPLERIERHLHPWVVFVILPVFALANAGVEVTAAALEGALHSPVTYGIALGLIVGKPIGILLASWLAVRTGIATLPTGVRWTHIAGVGVLAGIGFTVSLFITDLAYDAQLLKDEAKLGILAGSFIAAVTGYLLLRLLTRPGRVERAARN